MQLRSIALTSLVILIAWYWVKNREIKDQALVAAARYCKELSLMLLDQTIVLKRQRIRKNSRGRWCIERSYQFDFTSTGDDRYQGRIVMEGPRVSSIKLAPHRID
ncbi:MAG: DUF3301 domain-containing protein [Oleiphilus sp.]|nr:MAG: DUF3301 domain-containing protein [Oleiphilus sp.]